MTRETHEAAEVPDSPLTEVPFTARLNAYYRAVESESDSPLFVDPFAARLAGDLNEYFARHPRFTGLGGSQIARSYFIENNLLASWCNSHEVSQIVLLGAGLDTRAYRFQPLAKHSHTIFELDLPIVIQYKERILHDEQPLCRLVRVSSDLSQSNWARDLLDSGFSTDIPTFWILEGLVYYLGMKQVHDLFKSLAEMSADKSSIFADVCVPALADLKWGPFTDYFKWGIQRDDIPRFFTTSGWKVTTSFLDKYAHGKDVGQKGLILVHGSLDTSGISDTYVIAEDTSPPLDLDMQKFSRDLALQLIPKIEGLIETSKQDTESFLSAYVDFIQSSSDDLLTIAKSQENPILLGMISPRLLGNPLSIIDDSIKRTDDEIRSFIVSNLQAIVQLVYCGVKGIPAMKYRGTIMEIESRKITDSNAIAPLAFLLEMLQKEVGISNQSAI